MRRIILFLKALILISVLLSCRSEKPGILTSAEYLERLEKAVSTGNLPLRRLDELDPRDSYFLAIRTDAAGFSAEAALLARQTWEGSTGLLRERAAELAVELFFEQKDYPEADFLASIASAEYPENYSLLRYVAEAAYWQKRNSAVSEVLTALRTFDEAGDDYELLLFGAVAAYRMKAPDWQDEWIRLFTEAPSSPLILRGWDYLSFEESNPFALFPDYQELIRAKYELASGEYKSAEAHYRVWLESGTLSAMNQAVIEDIESVFLHTGSRAAGGALLESLASDRDSAEAYFAAARLYRRAGKLADAQNCMDRFFDLKGEGELTDRELWYSLDIRVRRNLSSALDSLDFYTAHWVDAAFFEDSLENLCTNLVRRRRWNDIAVLAGKLKDSGPVSVFDRCRYISERASELGYIGSVSFDGPYSDIYYRILSGDGLGELSILSVSSDPFASCDAEIPDFLNEYEQFIDGLLRFNTGDILAEVDRYKEHLSESFLVRCAKETAASGNHLDSIRIMYRFGGVPGRSGLSALYPDIYRTDIESAAEKSGIEPQLLFGIVWKESGFESDIVSRSGAVGLSQLMPPTATDVAARMDVENYDLTSPSDNLEIGAWYFNWLVSYVGNAAKAVLSYNGGPGRVRGWIREYPELPDDLFYEIIPVQETHLYGKNVITASVLYGLLYYGIPPEQTLRLFF